MRPWWHVSWHLKTDQTFPGYCARIWGFIFFIVLFQDLRYDDAFYIEEGLMYSGAKWHIVFSLISWRTCCRPVFVERTSLFSTWSFSIGFVVIRALFLHLLFDILIANWAASAEAKISTTTLAFTFCRLQSDSDGEALYPNSIDLIITNIYFLND